MDRQCPLSTNGKNTRTSWFISFSTSTCRLSYVEWEAKYSCLPESMLTYPYGERLCVWREGKLIFSAVRECRSRCVQQSTWSREHIARKWQILHHDNARLLKARIVQEYLEIYGIHTMVHPPYNPDLAPCDFLVVPNHEMCFGQR